MRIRSTLALTLALCAGAGGLAAATEVSPSGALLASVRRDFVPAAFVAMPDGAVVALDADRRELVTMRLGRAAEVHRLHGAGFDAATARLVDLDLGHGGQLLVLDAGVGTLWVATPEGRVMRRAGLFHTPVELGRAPGGMVTVWDPGVGSVTVFSRDLEPLAHLEGQGLSAQAAPGGRLARLEYRPGEVDVLLATPVTGPARSRSPQRKVASLRLDGPRTLVDATLLGTYQGSLWLHVKSSRDGSETPDGASLWELPPEPGATFREVRALPLDGADCLGCSAGVRLERDGRVAMHQVEGDLHTFWSFAQEGGQR